MECSRFSRAIHFRTQAQFAAYTLMSAMVLWSHDKAITGPREKSTSGVDNVDYVDWLTFTSAQQDILSHLGLDWDAGRPLYDLESCGLVEPKKKYKSAL